MQWPSQDFESRGLIIFDCLFLFLFSFLNPQNSVDSVKKPQPLFNKASTAIEKKVCESWIDIGTENGN